MAGPQRNPECPSFWIPFFIKGKNALQQVDQCICSCARNLQLHLHRHLHQRRVKLIQSWLNNFAFHVEINWIVFLLVGLITLFIAMLTISYRALQAALC